MGNVKAAPAGNRGLTRSLISAGDEAVMDATPPPETPPSTKRAAPRIIKSVVDLRRWSILGPNGCWLWTGRLKENGYGRGTMSGVGRMYVHRIAYTIANGPIPDGMTIDHLCWVRHCINPEHLQLLTAPENASRVQTKFAAYCPQGKHLKTPENTTHRPRGGESRVGCLDCNRERKRNTYKRSDRTPYTPEERRERARQSGRDSYQRNKEKILEKGKEYYQRNKETVSAQGKARYLAKKNEAKS